MTLSEGMVLFDLIKPIMNVLSIVLIVLVCICAFFVIGYIISIKSWNLWTKPGHSRFYAVILFPWTSLFTRQTESVDGYWDAEVKMIKGNYNESQSDHMGLMAKCVSDAPLTWDLYKLEYVLKTTCVWPLKLLFNACLIIVIISVWKNRHSQIQQALKLMKADETKRIETAH